MGPSLKLIRKKKSTFKPGNDGPARVKVGFPAGKTDGGVIDRAFFNEFGTQGSGKGFKTPRGSGFGGPIPERPFMRNTMRNNKAKYQADMVNGVRAILKGLAKGEELPALKRKVLAKLAAKIQGDIQDEITSLSSPPNSPVTIALKGSSNPLIDTGEMRQSVTWQYED